MFKKFFSLLSILFLGLMFFTKPAFASTSNLSQNFTDEKTNMKSITKNEYIRLLSKTENISIDQAIKLDNEITQKHQESLKNHNTNTSRSISFTDSTADGSGGYYSHVWVYKELYYAGGFRVELGAPAKLYTYHGSGQNTREFVNVGQPYAKAIGNGVYTYNPFGVYKSLDQGNTRLRIGTRGNFEISVSNATSMGLSVTKLVSCGFSQSTSTTYRKLIDTYFYEKL